MLARLPGPAAGHTPDADPARTTVPGVLARTRPRIGDALRLAAELVDGGCLVALEQVPAGDDGAELAELCGRVADAGLSAHTEVTVPVDRLGVDALMALADVGPGLALSGARNTVTSAAARLPAARIVVPAAEPGAESWCRGLADRRVRLTRGRGAGRVRLAPPGRGARADLAFVRCLNVLMAGGGQPALATTDPRLIAITGERAAWNDRTPDSWEHVMPDGIRIHDRSRLLAAGYRVRVVVRTGRGVRA
jgi:proline dehydrogenase